MLMKMYYMSHNGFACKHLEYVTKFVFTISMVFLSQRLYNLGCDQSIYK